MTTPVKAIESAVTCDNCGSKCEFIVNSYRTVTKKPVKVYSHPAPMYVSCTTADGFKRGVILK